MREVHFMAEELKEALKNVKDSYYDFVQGCYLTVKESEEYQKKLLQYLKDYPDAQTDDVLEYLFDEIVVLRPKP